MSPRKCAPREEVAAVRAEGRQPGWLRSRFMGQPWPRDGLAACGRPHCEVCDKAHASVTVTAGDQA
jgi:hypothetical protein